MSQMKLKQFSSNGWPHIKKVPSVTILNLLIKQFIFVWRLYEDFLKHSNLWFRSVCCIFDIYVAVKITNNANRHIFWFPFLIYVWPYLEIWSMIGIDVSDINIDRWWRWNLFYHVFCVWEKSYNNPWFQEYLTVRNIPESKQGLVDYYFLDL